MANDQRISGPFLAPGTQVRYDGLKDGGPEYGVVIHCWRDDEIEGHDCYVAFFGDHQPRGKPLSKPYILRYASNSLAVIDADAD